MKFVFALHQIVAEKKAIEPGTVFPMGDEKAFDELASMGAIRAATVDEIALFKMTDPVFAAEAAAAEAAAAAAAEVAAAEVAAAKPKGKASKNLID